MAYKPIGTFAQAMVDAIRRTEVMQAQSLAYLHKQFESEVEPRVSLTDLTWEQFIKERTEAYATPEGRAAMNEKYAKLLEPFIALAEQQQGVSNG